MYVRLGLALKTFFIESLNPFKVGGMLTLICVYSSYYKFGNRGNVWNRFPGFAAEDDDRGENSASRVRCKRLKKAFMERVVVLGF